MISYKSATTFLLLGAWAYFGTIGKTSNDQSYFRGGEPNLDSANRKLQQEAGIQFTTGHIVNGSPANGAEVPWFVHFGDGICGGSLIAPDRVLTAAHCVTGGWPSTVRIGATSQTNGNEVNVKCAKTHPEYDGFVGNDLAIIKLESSVDSQTVSYNRNGNIPATSETLTVIGLGRKSTGGPVADTLMEIDQTYVEPSTCDAAYGGGGVVDSSQVLCALTSNGGACNGDSGGPLFDSSFTQVGIVSFGSSSGCGAGVPDGYTRVSHYQTWIHEQTKQDDCDTCSFLQSCFNVLFQARNSVISFAKLTFRGEDSI